MRLETIERINLVGVPVDVCPPESLEGVVLGLLEKPGAKQVVFLSVWDLLRARRRTPFGECIRNASLVLPVSKSILWGASFLKLTRPARCNPFTTVVSVLGILEKHFKSLYLLGGRKKLLLRAEKNIHETCGGLQILGRSVGRYRKNRENDVITAINKAAPSLVLVGEGVSDKLCWAYKRRNRLTTGIFLYYPDAVGVFSKQKDHPSDADFAKGAEIWKAILRNPLKVFLVFPFMHYLLLLVGYRLFKKDTTVTK
jgi:N-acetylglucosaminyldiphosphoundecaprenol N-acetyl-beta-D-mannosaminyltransferase